AGRANVAGAGPAAQAKAGIDGQGQAERAQPARTVGSHELAVHRVQGEGRSWEGARPRQGPEILVRAAGDAVGPLGLGVIGLQVAVGNWPVPEGARQAAAVVPARVEVLGAGA